MNNPAVQVLRDPRPPYHRVLHRAVASRVRDNPSLYVSRARSTIRRWAERYPPNKRPRWMREWEVLLDGSLEGILDILEGDDERARWLRQSSPFSGVLTARERWSIVKSTGG